LPGNTANIDSSKIVATRANDGASDDKFTCLLKPCLSSMTKVLYTVQGKLVTVPYIAARNKKTSE